MDQYDYAFKDSEKFLKNEQLLIFYGPFKFDNKHTSHSNYFFDNSFKMQNELWGVRNLKEVNDEDKKWFFNKFVLVCLQIVFQQFIEKFLE